MMGDGVKQILAKLIQLADHVTKLADDVRLFRAECQELKAKTERLAALLRQAARAELYERPARRIMDDTEQVLEKALALVTKCRLNGIIKQMLTIIPTGAFRKMSIGLDNSIGDVSWLLRGDEKSNAEEIKELTLPRNIRRRSWKLNCTEDKASHEEAKAARGEDKASSEDAQASSN